MLVTLRFCEAFVLKLFLYWKSEIFSWLDIHGAPTLVRVNRYCLWLAYNAPSVRVERWRSITIDVGTKAS